MSVSVPGSNMMMRGQKTEGSAESGQGVVMAGFYAPNGDVQARIKELESNQGPFTEIGLHESEGWTFFLGANSQDAGSLEAPMKIGFFRRESHRFFEDLPASLFQTKARRVHRLTLSQASGFLTLAYLYSDQIRV